MITLVLPGDTITFNNAYGQNMTGKVIRKLDDGLIVKRPEWYGEEFFRFADFQNGTYTLIL